jgi:GDP-mannose 6-dehydrogenase
VLGLGYVGCVTAACLASLGHRVTGVDRDAFKVASVRNGKAPFYEPGLERLVREGVSAGRLSASTTVDAALPGADVALICVGTPSERNGNLGLEQLRRVVEELSRATVGRSRPLVVAVRSTVFPGTSSAVVEPAFAHHEQVKVVSNPEFLREGSAVRDFLEPSLLVAGGGDRTAVEKVAGLYASLPATPCLVSLRTAEMIKYACNAFHALKISFANEIGTLAAKLGVDPFEVMDTLCQDRKLNLSGAYLRPGFAFGGSCLPKDLRALAYRASRLDLKLPLLESILPGNSEHLERAIQAVLDLDAPRIGVVGLAFKENTDDLRESPVVLLLERLIGKGRQVRVFDAHIRLDEIYGSNRTYILETIPHIGGLLDNRIEDTLDWASHIVLSQAQDAETLSKIRRSGLPVSDLAQNRPENRDLLENRDGCVV